MYLYRLDIYYVTNACLCLNNLFVCMYHHGEFERNGDSVHHLVLA